MYTLKACLAAEDGCCDASGVDLQKIHVLDRVACVMQLHYCMRVRPAHNLQSVEPFQTPQHTCLPSTGRLYLQPAGLSLTRTPVSPACLSCICIPSSKDCRVRKTVLGCSPVHTYLGVKSRTGSFVALMKGSEMCLVSISHSKKGGRVWGSSWPRC